MLDDLRADLAHAQNLLAALGPRPEGDLAGIKALATTLDDYSERAASAARLARSLPSEVVFVAPAAANLSAYAEEVSSRLRTRSEVLGNLADQARSTLKRIRLAQEEYDRNRSALSDAVDSVLGAIGRIV